MLTNNYETQSYIIEASQTVTYICNAKVGTSLNEPKWQIMRVTNDSWVTTKEWAIDPNSWKPTDKTIFLPNDYASYEYWFSNYTDAPLLSFTINGWASDTSDREVNIQITYTSYVNVDKFLISESNEFNINNVMLDDTFTLSEWLWVKTLYLWAIDMAWNVSWVQSQTIELIEQLLIPENLELEWFHEYEE